MRFFLRSAPLDEQAEADAIDWLRTDHEQTQELFAAYAQMVREAAPELPRQRLAGLICTTLALHDALETELFYPAVRAALANPAPLAAVLEDHLLLRTLVSQLRAAQPAQPEYDARVARLGRQLHEHVRLEERAVFAPLRHQGVPLVELAAALARRRRQLLAAIDPRA